VGGGGCTNSERGLNSSGQAGGRDVKFILMNSFSTSDGTRAFLNKSHADLVARGTAVSVYVGVCYGGGGLLEGGPGGGGPR
jgi:hypothetical protein